MRIPILLYHDVRADNFNLASVPPEFRPYILKDSQFLAQMDWLHKNAYNVVGLKELVNGLDGRGLNRTVCLAFDDGWRSNYEVVYPILNKYAFKATFFITLENVGMLEMMHWEQIQQLHSSGMTIGSHNLTHRIPLELNDVELNYELSVSKRLLEAKLGRQVEFFSAPTGFFDARIEKLAKQNMYRGVCFTRAEFNNFDLHKHEFLKLNKIAIKRQYSLQMFQEIVEGRRSTLGRLRVEQMGRDLAKAVLGPKGYNGVRLRLLRRNERKRSAPRNDEGVRLLRRQSGMRRAPRNDNTYCHCDPERSEGEAIQC